MIRAIEKKILHFSVYDIVIISFLALLAYGVSLLAKRWTGPLTYQTPISLAPLSLVGYTFLSMSRGFIAYGLSLLFTLSYGYIAARNKYAERILVPLLDILQSVPVLGFLPGLVIGMIALFPGSNIGLEFASIIMIFTGQVWNMTFSFYQSLKALPQDLMEASKLYGLSKWKRFWTVEVSFAMPGLVWNSMMSMAGGWFFLSICEAFTLGGRSYKLAGIGSYMATAIEKGYIPGEIYGIIAMVLMIVAIDVFFWRPIVAWADKFKFEESASDAEPTSFILDILRNSHVLKFFRELFDGTKRIKRNAGIRFTHPAKPAGKTGNVVFYSALGLISVLTIWQFFSFVGNIKFEELRTILFGDALTAWRVYSAVALSALWTLPVGILIGRKVRVARRMQPVVQVLASFPAPMIYPWVVMLFPNLNYSSILLMMLGTQWYILFNVIAGASSIPNQLKEASKMLKLNKLKVWTTLYIPTVFPYLITGIITAAGGAWNASIVAEYMTFNGRLIEANGIGAQINDFTVSGNLHLLALSVVIMSLSVVLINRMVWRPLQKFASERFAMN